MSILIDAWHWFLQSAQWHGPDGIPVRLGEHIYYTLLSLLIAAAVAIPLGLLIGHTGRGSFFVVNLSNGARALPTAGVLVLVVTLTGIGLLPVLTALVVLAIPSILVNTYAGVRQVSPETVDAARGMGMRGGQVLWQVEAPLAVPLIMTGLRTAAIQIVSTATVAAYVGLGGLGRFIFDGLARRDHPAFAGGTVIVVGLALGTEAAFVAVRKLIVKRTRGE
ncbi:ABC transporter permease [Longispora sp. K20-0274]|uniref:ABC transporter permease n=1 Tax=Longispora sp. K20-0274 TaxID=3088255 RepID=UPI00399B89CA